MLSINKKLAGIKRICQSSWNEKCAIVDTIRSLDGVANWPQLKIELMTGLKDSLTMSKKIRRFKKKAQEKKRHGSGAEIQISI